MRCCSLHFGTGNGTAVEASVAGVGAGGLLAQLPERTIRTAIKRRTMEKHPAGRKVGWFAALHRARRKRGWNEARPLESSS